MASLRQRYKSNVNISSENTELVHRSGTRLSACILLDDNVVLIIYVPRD